MRAAFAFLAFTGRVRMEDPQEEFIIVREIEVDRLGSPLYPRHSHHREIIPENDRRPPLGVYFGRVLGTGLREGRVEKYCLNKRKYLGPTSMDTELSMIMTNLGQVRDVVVVVVVSSMSVCVCRKHLSLYLASSFLFQKKKCS